MSDPRVGRVLSKKNFVVDGSTMDDYFRGLDLTPSSDGRIPSTIASGPDNAYFDEIAFGDHIGHLWMRQQWTVLAPLEEGLTYSVGGEILDIYPRRDRTVVAYAVVLADSAGRRVLATEHHQSFLCNRQGTGEVVFRDPKTKPGARKFELPEGETFGGLERAISAEMCGEFFHGDANYHTDREASHKLGFREVVVGGRMTLAYAAHILEEHFSDCWWQGGHLDAKFTNPVWAGDTVIARGVVTGPDEEDPERTGAFVWLSKPDGTVVLVAKASVAL